LAAGTLARAVPAQAADNDFVMLGTNNTETHRTVIEKNAQDGYAAIQGDSTGSDPGILGDSPSGIGLYGIGSTGVYGTTSDVTGHAIRGEHAGGGTGVFGETNSTGHAGVAGNNLGTGAGVSGTGGVGVSGLTVNATGAGVQGVTNASGGVGVAAYTNVAGGIALGVFGPSTFSQSGLAAIPAGSKSVTVSGVALRVASLVLATLQNKAGVSIAYAQPNVGGSSITIALNKAVPTGRTARVAWFVVN
jgi:hypothetical protein